MIIPFDECFCSCHKTVTELKHVTPCCKRCPICQKHISFVYLTKHRQRHEEEAANRKFYISEDGDY